MKYKIAIISGIILWILITLATILLNPYINNNFDNSHISLLLPLWIIIVTSFFTIIYIRKFNSNELLEGLKLGIVFSIIYIIGDYLLLIFNINYTLIDQYPTYLLSMVIFIIITTTFIGYLAQMPIELR